MEFPKRHQYRPLNGGNLQEIRLLILYPYGSRSDSELFGHLEHVSYLEHPPYEAISYAWGSNDQSERLNICDPLGGPKFKSPPFVSLISSWWMGSASDPSSSEHQVPDTGFIPITPNLNSALKRLRKKTSERVLWIDQLCINQENYEERSIQVQLMGQIYQRAAKTVVWLGEEDEHVSAALYLSSKLAAAMRAYNQAEVTRKRDTLSGPSSRRRNPLEAFLGILGRDADLTTSNWQSFNNFYNRPWFGRLWIVQEIAFSKEVVILCGSRTTTMPWATVDQNVISSESEYHQLLPYPIGFLNCFTIATIRDRIWIRSAHPGRLAASLGIRPEDLPAGKDFDPIDIIAYTKTFECCDPKDRFFALYGLLKSMFNWSEEPNYSLTVHEVYTDMTRLLIKRDRSLRILSGSLLRHDDSAWPSWVPDWSVRDSLDRCCNAFHTLSSTFCASGTEPLVIGNHGDIYFSQPDTIFVCGWQFDICTAVLDVLEWDQKTFPSHNPTLTQWIDHISQNAFTWQDATQIVFRTFIADGFGAKRKNNTFQNYSTDQLALWQNWALSITGRTSEELDRCLYIQMPAYGANFPNPIHIDQHTRAYDFAARSACRGRRLVVTSRGFVGLCPRNTQEGDRICVLRGAKAPFVLRKNQDHFTMVGECYVDGIMYGNSLASTFDKNGPLHLAEDLMEAEYTTSRSWFEIR